MKGIGVLVIVSLLASSATVSFAQQAPGPVLASGQSDEVNGTDKPAPRGRDKALAEKKQKELREKVDAVRIWKLTEALKLDADTSAKLSAVLSSVNLKRMDVQREQRESVRTLRQSLKSPRPDETKIKAALEKLEKDHLVLQELRSQELNSLKQILSVEQQARYLLFQQEFRNEMRGMIEGARGARQNKDERGPRNGPGHLQENR
jgi:Spy/CpxP family protein refolding chaperone